MSETPGGCGTAQNIAVFTAAVALGITGTVAVLALCCGAALQIALLFK